MCGLIATILLAGAAQLPPAPPPAPPTPSRDATTRDAPPARTGTAVIRGRVTDRETDQPLARITVTLTGPIQTQTDANGHYQFTRLPAGSYTVLVDVSTHQATYLRHSYGDTGPFDPTRPTKRTPIELKDGEVREDVNLALWRALAIQGRVVNEFGDPMANIGVRAERVDRRGDGSGMSRYTDDRGLFRIFGLTPGDYRVCSEPGSLGGSGGPGTPRERPVKTCYPSTVVEAEAHPVRISTTDSDIEIRVLQSRTFTISGTVVDSSGGPVERPNVNLFRVERNSTSSSGMPVMPGGQFILRGVVRGEYTLTASVGQPDGTVGLSSNVARDREYGFLPIRVDAADLEGLVIVTQKATRVVGRVVFEDGVPPARTGQLPLRIEARPEASNRAGPPPGAIVKENLTFELTGLWGPFTLAVSGLPRDWFVKAIRYEREDVTDLAVEFKNISDPRALEVVLSTPGAQLSGRVLDEKGEPVREYRVIMFPADERRWRDRWLAMPFGGPAKDGTFRIGQKRPGEYLVVGLAPEDFFPPDDPEAFAALAKIAERVTLFENEQKTIDLHLMKRR